MATISNSKSGGTAVRRRERPSSHGLRTVLYILVFLAAAAGGAYWYLTRPTVPRAEQLFDMGRTDEGVAMLEGLSDDGNTDASLLLGTMFYTGRNGAGLNPARALPYLRKAADAGHDDARVMVGDIAYNGLAGRPDYALAFQYLAPMEHARNATAQSILGRMFFLGQGAEKDEKRALPLLELADGLGDKNAAAALGRIHFEGLAGMPVNYEKAEEYLARTPPGMDGDIDFHLGQMFFLGLGGRRDLARAAERLENPELADNPEAQYYLGTMDFLGRGKQAPDFAAAKERLDKAVAGGVKAANYPLAMMHYRGDIGSGPDYAQAVPLARIAADGADGAVGADAKALLGEMYYYGRGVDRDYDRAAEYLLQSVADQKDEEKKYNYLLGRLYYYGHGVPQDYDKAAAHVMHAAGTGNLEAQALLANMYYYGRGLDQNLDSALFYLRDGLRENVPAAMSLRGRMYYYGDGDEWSDDLAVELLEAASKGGDEDAAALLRERSMRESEKEKLKEEMRKAELQRLQQQGVVRN